ncbi:MAG: hypothetical protein ACYDHE_06290 [Candidatus Acidiferrales bacterium]
MRSLSSQNPICAPPFGVVPQRLGAQYQARLLKGSLEQSGMELADDFAGRGTGLPKDAVPGQDLVIIGHDVVRTQGSQLAQHRLRGVSGLVHERRAVASARLSGGFDTLLTACLEALSQKASQAGESTHRIAEIDRLASQSIKVGGLAGFSPALPDRQVSERDEALEMSMRNRSMHAGGFGSIVNCPFGLVHIKVEQDPPTGPILKRANRAFDLAYLVLTHSASLSAHVGGETDRPYARLARAPRCGNLKCAVRFERRAIRVRARHRTAGLLRFARSRVMMSFGFIAAYTVLIAVASVVEVPIARGFASVQLNLLIRLGSVAVAILALVIVHGVAIPTGPPALAGLGIGVLTGSDRSFIASLSSICRSHSWWCYPTCTS